jgi:hypothetical protein
MGERVLIGRFSSHLRWCNNFSCPFLSGGHKGASLHQLLIEVILKLKTCKKYNQMANNKKLID